MQHESLRQRLKRLASGAMAVAMAVTVMVGAIPLAGAVTQKDIDNLKSQAASLNAQKSEVQSELNKLQNSKNAALDQKFLLEQKIGLLQNEITVSEQAIANYGQQIQQKTVELAQAQAEEEKYYDEFCQRVRTMEERGSVSYWAVLFNANSFADLLDQINVISEVMDYDNEIMDKLEQARIAVEEAKASLEKSKADEEVAKAGLESQKTDLQAEQANVQAVINQIQSQADVYEKKMHDIEEDIPGLTSQIAQAEAQYAAQIAAQKAAEEAAKKKAAEEAARKAAEEAAKQQQQQQNKPTTPTTPVTPDEPETPSGPSTSGYLWPLPGYTRISSPFGYRNCPFHGREFHGAVDVPAPGGTPIKAAKSGVVIIARYNSSYGNYVTIAHSDGSRTVYCHQSRMAVSAGQTVSQGQTIGYVGSTGSSTGNHLHFELWLSSSSSSRVNPVAYCS